MAEVFRFPAPDEVRVVRKALVLAKRFEETEASLLSALELVRQLIDETEANDVTRQLSEQRDIIVKALTAAREAFDIQLRVLLGHDAEASKRSTVVQGSGSFEHQRSATDKKIKFVNELIELIEGTEIGAKFGIERDDILSGLRNAKASFEQQLTSIDRDL